MQVRRRYSKTLSLFNGEEVMASAVGHSRSPTPSTPHRAKFPFDGRTTRRTIQLDYHVSLEGSAMLMREDVRRLALEAKERLGLTWPQLGEAVGHSPVYAALLVYGYGQASEEEAEALSRTLELPEEAKSVLRQAPHRTPAQPWPPTDPFIYRLYEMVMLYGPVFKDVA